MTNLVTILKMIASRIEAAGDPGCGAVLNAAAVTIANSPEAQEALLAMGLMGKDEQASADGFTQFDLEALTALGEEAARSEMDFAADVGPVGDDTVVATHPNNGSTIAVKPIKSVGLPTASNCRALCQVVGKTQQIIIAIGHVQGKYRDAFFALCQKLSAQQGIIPQNLRWQSDGASAADVPPV